MSRIWQIVVLCGLFGALYVLTVQSTSRAQAIGSPCDAVLRAGVYDFLRQEASGYKFSEYQNEIQRVYNEYQKDAQSGNIQAEYKLFSGSVSLSREQIKAIGSALFSKEIRIDQVQNDTLYLRQTISEAPIEAWSKCITANTDGLKVETNFGSNFEGPLTIQLRYTGTKGQSIQISTVTVRGGLSNCSGSLKSVLNTNKPVMLSSSWVSLSCARAFASKPIQDRDRSIWSRASSVEIETEAGTVVRTLGPIFASKRTPSLESEVSSLKAALGMLKGTIAFFSTPDCPKGWDRENTLNGRYPVGVNPDSKANVGKAVGQALLNEENRPAGQHTHLFTDSNVTYDNPDPARGIKQQKGDPWGPNTTGRNTELGNGLIPGTNAPYMQLSACKKQ